MVPGCQFEPAELHQGYEASVSGSVPRKRNMSRLVPSLRVSPSPFSFGERSRITRDAETCERIAQAKRPDLHEEHSIWGFLSCLNHAVLDESSQRLKHKHVRRMLLSEEVLQYALLQLVVATDLSVFAVLLSSVTLLAEDFRCCSILTVGLMLKSDT